MNHIKARLNATLLNLKLLPITDFNFLSFYMGDEEGLALGSDVCSISATSNFSMKETFSDCLSPDSAFS